MGIASMILGILSISSGNIIFAILALVFSSKAKASEGQTPYSQAGFICGLIGLIVSIIVTIIVVLYIIALSVGVLNAVYYY